MGTPKQSSIKRIPRHSRDFLGRKFGGGEGEFGILVVVEMKD